MALQIVWTELSIFTVCVQNINLHSDVTSLALTFLYCISNNIYLLLLMGGECICNVYSDRLNITQ